MSPRVWTGCVGSRGWAPQRGVTVQPRATPWGKGVPLYPTSPVGAAQCRLTALLSSPYRAGPAWHARIPGRCPVRRRSGQAWAVLSRPFRPSETACGSGPHPGSADRLTSPRVALYSVPTGPPAGRRGGSPCPPRQPLAAASDAGRTRPGCIKRAGTGTCPYSPGLEGWKGGKVERRWRRRAGPIGPMGPIDGGGDTPKRVWAWHP